MPIFSRSYWDSEKSIQVTPGRVSQQYKKYREGMWEIGERKKDQDNQEPLWKAKHLKQMMEMSPM